MYTSGFLTERQRKIMLIKIRQCITEAQNDEIFPPRNTAYCRGVISTAHEEEYSPKGRAIRPRIEHLESFQGPDPSLIRVDQGSSYSPSLPTPNT